MARGETLYTGDSHDTPDEVGIYIEPAYYHVRCGNTVGPYNTYTASGGGGYHDYNSYLGPED